MFLEHREKEENKRQATAGYDLTDAYAQISYCLPGEPCPKTISLQADQEQYLIPALLGRYTDQDLWVYGPKAQAAAAAGEVFLADGLLTKAAHQEMVEVGGQNYSSVALLSLFLKRTMSLLAPIVRPERLKALVFSVPEVSVPVLSAVTDAVGMLGLKNASLFLIGRAESFFYYNICQPEELWKQDVLLCDFSGTFLHTLLFTANRKTSPVACFVEEADWKEVAAGREDLDQCFLETMKAVIGDRNISCVYLIGEGFLGEWYQESLRFLCQERRVFLGNNLYSKGACYAARQRMTPGSVSEDYVFLGKDMLKANISLYVEKRGQDSCQPLLDAGTNWYDAKTEIDFLLEEENRFSLRITPLNGGEIRDVEIQTVSHEMLSGDTGYIRISEFSEVTSDQYKKAFADLKEQGMKKLVVDLRDNPGGLLTAVCGVLRQILPEGLIVYTEDKNGKREEETCDGKNELDMPLAVLVNGNSASASEIFAGAVKDYGIGTIVGTTTYGKGVVQTIQPLTDGSAVKITIAKYFTPKGNDINKKGITPDVEAELSGDITDWTELTHKEDAQLQTALKEIGQS